MQGWNPFPESKQAATLDFNNLQTIALLTHKNTPSSASASAPATSPPPTSRGPFICSPACGLSPPSPSSPMTPFVLLPFPLAPERSHTSVDLSLKGSTQGAPLTSATSLFTSNIRSSIRFITSRLSTIAA